MKVLPNLITNVLRFLSSRDYVNEATAKHIIWYFLEELGYTVVPEYKIERHIKVDLVAYNGQEVIAIEIKGRREELWSGSRKIWGRLEKLTMSGYFDKVFLAVPFSIESEVQKYLRTLARMGVSVMILGRGALVIPYEYRLIRYHDDVAKNLAKISSAWPLGHDDVVHALWEHLMSGGSSVVLETPIAISHVEAYNLILMKKSRHIPRIDVLEVPNFRNACEAVCRGGEIIGYEVKPDVRNLQEIRSQLELYARKSYPFTSRFYLVIPENCLSNEVLSMCRSIEVGLVTVSRRGRRDTASVNVVLESQWREPEVCAVLSVHAEAGTLEVSDLAFEPVRFTCKHGDPHYSYDLLGKERCQCKGYG